MTLKDNTLPFESEIFKDLDGGCTKMKSVLRTNTDNYLVSSQLSQYNQELCFCLQTYII